MVIIFGSQSTPSPCETSIKKTAQLAIKYATCNRIAHRETQGIHISTKTATKACPSAHITYNKFHQCYWDVE
jgi:hypothetical protein